MSFIYGLSTIPWETDLSAELTASTSNLPSALDNESTSIYFPDSNDNGAYNGEHKLLKTLWRAVSPSCNYESVGVMEGYREDLLLAISNTSYWLTSDSSTFPPEDTLNDPFTILSPSSSPTSFPSQYTPPPPACMDEDGNYVDSWVSLSQNSDYAYYWHDNLLGFVKSPYRLNQTSEGAIMGTTAQLYDSNLDLENIAYALYNVSICFVTFFTLSSNSAYFMFA